MSLSISNICMSPYTMPDQRDPSLKMSNNSQVTIPTAGLNDSCSCMQIAVLYHHHLEEPIKTTAQKYATITFLSQQHAACYRHWTDRITKEYNTFHNVMSMQLYSFLQHLHLITVKVAIR